MCAFEQMNIVWLDGPINCAMDNECIALFKSVATETKKELADSLVISSLIDMPSAINQWKWLIDLKCYD